MDRTLYTSRGRSIAAFLNPVSMVRNLWRRRRLTWDLAKRELGQQYRGTALGWLWVIVTPLMLLAIYTFAFGVVFNARPRRFPNPDEVGMAGYALELFAGLLAFTLLTDVVGKAPRLVIGNRNYVKKVVFPLEVLIPSTMIQAITTMVIGYAVWFLVWGIFIREAPRVTSLWLPVVLVPLVLGTSGVGWVLASLGVFIRDVAQTTTLATRMLFFLTPIFYTVDRLPEAYKKYLYLNPLTLVIEDVRDVLIAGTAPDPIRLGASYAIGALLALGGYAFFMKSKRAFADVI